MTTYQGELTLQEVVKLIEAETDEGGNILEELTDQDIRGIYEQLSHEDKRRFRQFRKFHCQYFGVYGEHLPSYHMAKASCEGSDAGATQCLCGRHRCQKSRASG